MMELFYEVKIVYGFYPLDNIFAKISIVNVWLGSDYASELNAYNDMTIKTEDTPHRLGSIVGYNNRIIYLNMSLLTLLKP